MERLLGGSGDFLDFGGFIACNDGVQLRLAGVSAFPMANCTQ
jgi:hypothetical protein